MSRECLSSMIRAWAAAAVLLAATVVPCLAGDAEVEVEATGYAQAGEAGARRDALYDAMKSAVEKAMGTHLTVELTVEKKQLVGQKILSKSRGFIKSHEVLEETKDGDVLAVRIKAVVKSGQLKGEMAAIGLIMERKEKPRVMVLTSNRQGGSVDRGRGPWVHTLFSNDEASTRVHSTVESILSTKGFNLVDGKHDKRRRQIELAVTKNDSSKIASLAADAGAEVVINVVTVRNFKELKRLYGTEYKFYDSEVTIRAVRAGTGQVLFSGSKAGTPSATVEPMVKAANSVTGDCVAAILKRWASDVQNSNVIIIKVKKVSFGKLVKFQKALSGIKGIDAVRRRSFAGGEANIEVDWAGKADDLGVAVSEIKSPAVEITSATQQVIELEVK